MCGIAGLWAPTSPNYDPKSTLRRMADALRNRGPDSSGVWWHDVAHLGFGHQRLSILDLSDEGAQPMRSSSGRYIINYNGEIFNYRVLRRELEPARWRGHSDTEVMLEAFERWGVEAAVRRFNGQFAFAVWDEEARSLSLVRDRIGIKPLYYGWLNSTLVFASELDAFREHPGFEYDPNPQAVLALLEVGYIPAPLSINNRVYKLRPGSILTLQGPGDDPPPRRFWSLSDVASGADAEYAEPEAAADRLDGLLRDSVRLRLISDVPVGAFLSGGVDSSLVCGVMQAVASGPIKTYSIGFEESTFDEAPYARHIADHLGTDHTELYVTPEEAMEVLPDLPALYDEPFADSSQIPTYLVSKLARHEVKVCLSGDGGDELFAGYDRYERALRRWPKISRVPHLIRRALLRASQTVTTLEKTPVARSVTRRLPSSVNRRVGYGQFARALSLLGSESIAEFYRRSVAVDASGIAGPAISEAVGRRPTIDVDVPRGLEPLEAMSYIDTLRYLPDDILVKVDRASMAVSLEARVPLLDHRIVEYCWSLDPGLKIRNGERKWLLKYLLKRYAPASLTERPKKGFGVPIGSWLRGPLRDWAESLLSVRALERQEIFDSDAVQTIWHQHLSGRADVPHLLWRILMYQAWAREAGAPAPKTRETATAA